MADTFLGAELSARNLIATRFGAGQHKAALILDGDSKANEPGDALAWVCARKGLVAPALVPIGVGGSQSGSSTSAPIGLTAPSRLALIASTVAAQASAGYVPDVSLKIGTNDFAAGASPSTVVANIRKYWEGYAKPAGARYLLLNAVDPRADTPSLNPAIIAFNRLARSYAAANPFDVIFVDPTSMLVDPASAGGAPLGGTGNTFGAVTFDGLHQSANGPLVASPAYEAAAAAVLYAPRAGLNLSKADIYVVAGVSMNNMIGFDTGYDPTGTGRTAAIGGTDGITNSGTGTKAGTPPLGFSDSGTLTGTASVTRSPQTITLFGQSFSVVRYAFSGTPTSNLQIGIDQLNYSQGGGISYEMQAELAFFRERALRLLGARTELQQRNASGLHGQHEPRKPVGRALQSGRPPPCREQPSRPGSAVSVQQHDHPLRQGGNPTRRLDRPHQGERDADGADPGERLTNTKARKAR